MHLTSEERRKYKRYRIDNAVSISSLGVFQVSDISEGGFCFRCPPYTPITADWKTDFLSSSASLEGLPARMVWISITENGTHEFLPTIVGVKFGKLTKKQDSILRELIDTLEKTKGTLH